MSRAKPYSLLFLMTLFSACSSSPRGGQPVSTPITRASDHVEVYHGVSVPDPYHWLEDLDSAETRAWVQAQNEVTFAYLEQLPRREKIRQRLEEIWNYPKIGAPRRRGNIVFQSRNNGLQDHAVITCTEGEGAPSRVLLDPNQMSADGSVSLAGLSYSDDGRYVAWGASQAGSDWTQWRVRDVASGQDLADHLRWVKFSGAEWLPDSSGFYYSRYPEPEEGSEMESVNENHSLWFHRLGTDQSEDLLVYGRPDHPKWGFAGTVTHEGRYLVITAWEGTDSRNRVFFKDLGTDGEVRPLFTDFDAGYDFLGNRGSTFYFLTHKDAPRGRIFAVDVNNPQPSSWREVVPEGTGTISTVRMVQDSMIVVSMHDAHDRMDVFALDGTHRQEIPMPGIGNVVELTGRQEDEEVHFSFTSFTSPPEIYHLDIQTWQTKKVFSTEIAFDSNAYETEQIWYPSKDGTRIPMFLVHKKGLDRSQTHPVYLYGYGGFNISLQPQFSPSVAAWLEMGGVFAQPSLRGGGEFGEAWHEAGMLLDKQNVFDDFIGAAEWLISNGYTTTPQLGIGGGSNGGLLVGACMAQRPDLFGACLPAVGVMDMLRFHKFTIGWAWVPEYGSSDDPQHFPYLLGYSPLHNLKPGTAYPPTLVLTADHDDRVVPSHSFKFASALQAAQGGDAPCLIRIETRAGHGAGIPTSKRIEEAADRWAFLANHLGM